MGSTKDETFELIRLYEVDGKVYTLTIGEPVPPEAKLADNGVISSEMINGLMAQGKFILGGEEKLYIATNKVTEQSTFIHDLSVVDLYVCFWGIKRINRRSWLC